MFVYWNYLLFEFLKNYDHIYLSYKHKLLSNFKCHEDYYKIDIFKKFNKVFGQCKSKDFMTRKYKDIKKLNEPFFVHCKEHMKL
jgi:hypothetical protein